MGKVGAGFLAAIFLLDVIFVGFILGLADSFLVISLGFCAPLISFFTVTVLAVSVLTFGAFSLDTADFGLSIFGLGTFTVGAFGVAPASVSFFSWIASIVLLTADIRSSLGVVALKRATKSLSISPLDRILSLKVDESGTGPIHVRRSKSKKVLSLMLPSFTLLSLTTTSVFRLSTERMSPFSNRILSMLLKSAIFCAC